MHRILCVQELLLNIFGHFHEYSVHRRIDKRSLTALARTCKAFKEPALDILWAELQDLTPLVRCLPEASCLNLDGLYSLKGPLEEADWDLILGFTRRVRVCNLARSFGLAADCIEELSKLPTSTSTIFPKLWKLDIRSSGQEVVPFLRHLTGPRLTVLRLRYTQDLGDAIYVFGSRCPNIIAFDYRPSWTDRNPSRISGLTRQWPKLHSLHCENIAVNVAVSIHLSGMDNLHFLNLELYDAEIERARSPSRPSIVTFPALVNYELHTQFLATFQRFFGHLCLPAIKELDINLDEDPTQSELMSFLAILPKTCGHQSLIDISIHVIWLGLGALYGESGLNAYQINFRLLCPLTVFVNIQAIYLNVSCGIDLNEQELLQLVAAWPYLQVFVVGWCEMECNASSAITPGGFVQLLERCRSLSEFSFPFNTHGYTEIPQGHPWRGLEMVEDVIIDVRKSPIEEESIHALAIFFHVAPFPEFRLTNTWDSLDPRADEEHPKLSQLYSDRWGRVGLLACKLWEERDKLLDSLEVRGRIPAFNSNGCDSDDDVDVD